MLLTTTRTEYCYYERQDKVSIARPARTKRSYTDRALAFYRVKSIDSALLFADRREGDPCIALWVANLFSSLRGDMRADLSSMRQ